MFAGSPPHLSSDHQACSDSSSPSLKHDATDWRPPHLSSVRSVYGQELASSPPLQRYQSTSPERARWLLLPISLAAMFTIWRRPPVCSAIDRELRRRSLDLASPPHLSSDLNPVSLRTGPPGNSLPTFSAITQSPAALDSSHTPDLATPPHLSSIHQTTVGTS